MHFRAHESMAPDVVPDTGSDINQEVLGTGVASAKVNAVAGELEAVKSRGLPTDAAKQIGAYLLIETRLVHSIDVKKDGAISLAETAEVSD